MKRILCIVVSLALVLSLLPPIHVQAADREGLLALTFDNLNGWTLLRDSHLWKELRENIAPRTISNGVCPRVHRYDIRVQEGNAAGDAFIYRIGVGLSSGETNGLIVSPSKNWKDDEECVLGENGVPESQLLRLHKGLAAYTQQNWMTVNTNATHVVGVTYNKENSSELTDAQNIANYLKAQETMREVKTFVGPAKTPEDYPGADAVLRSESNMNVLFVNATKNKKFRSMCAETDEHGLVKLNGKDFVFNAALLEELKGKSPDDIAKALYIIKDNQSLRDFKPQIEAQLRNILTSGHYTAMYAKAWTVGSVAGVTVNGLEINDNPTIEAMGHLTALMCLYAYMPEETYKEEVNRYLTQLSAAMKAKRTDGDMHWTSAQFSSIVVEQLVPVKMQGKVLCLSAPELMAAVCTNVASVYGARFYVNTKFCRHATIGIQNDCWNHFKAAVAGSLNLAWEGETMADRYASMLNWFHNEAMIHHCDASCKRNANGMQAAIQNALGIEWKHNGDELVCKAAVDMEVAPNDNGDITAYINNEGTHDHAGRCYLSGISTNGVYSMGGYGAMSATVSHEAKCPKPQCNGTFDVKVIKNSQADTNDPKTTYKVRMDSKDSDKLADPFYVKATYKFAEGKENDDVVDSLVDAIRGNGGTWSTADVKVRFRMYANALPYTATNYTPPAYGKFAKWEATNDAVVDVDNSGSKRKCSLKVLPPESKTDAGPPGSQFKDAYTARYESLSKEQLKKLLKGGSVSWETQWYEVKGLNKTGARYFVYRIEADILYKLGSEDKVLKVEDTKDTFDKDHKCTERHYEYRKCAPDDGGWLKIFVSFKGSQFHDCTPPNLTQESFPKMAGKVCTIPKRLGWAKELAKQKYNTIRTENDYWEPTVEVKKLKKANGDKINTAGKADIEIKKNMRIGKKTAKAPVASIYLRTNQDPPPELPGEPGTPGIPNKTTYTIQYYFDEEHDASFDKTVSDQTIDTDATVTFPDESEHKEGYTFDKCEPVDGANDHTAKIRLKANGSENIIKAYYVESKFKYTSAIAKPYAEIKCGKLEQGGSQEPYEAMAGFPTTEDMYFGSGGNETIADVEYEYKRDGKATRKYTFKNALPDDCNWGLSYPYAAVTYNDMTKTEAYSEFKKFVEELNAGDVTHKTPGVNKWKCPGCGQEYGDNNEQRPGNWNDEEGPGKTPQTYKYGRWTLKCTGASSWGHKKLEEKTFSPCTHKDKAEKDAPPPEPCGNVAYYEAMDAVTAEDHHGEPSDEEKKQERSSECYHGDGDAPPPQTRPVAWYPVRWNFVAEYEPVFTPTADNTLTWTQDVEGFNYNQINKACVWGLTESLVNGTDKLTTEVKIKGSLMDQGAGVRYNVANANTSEAGRLLYSVSKNQHDNVTWKGTDFTDDEHVCPKCIQAHTFEHLIDPAKNEVGSNPEETYNEVTCISDFLMQRTSAGDLSFTYDEYKAGNASKDNKVPIIKPGTAEKHIKKNGKYQQDCDKVIETDPITFEDANEEHDRLKIVANDKTFKGINLQPQDMPYCGYSGNFKNTSGKYQTSWSAKTNVNIDDSSLAINDPDYKSTSNVPKPAPVPATVRLGKNAIEVPDMDVRNGHYVLGPSSVFYKRLVAYNRDPAKVSMVYEKDDPEMGTKALNQASNADYGGQEGIVLTTTYSPAHGNINDVVVHDPVTCQYSLFFNTAGARDQRVTEGGIVEDAPEVASCPGNPMDCPYSHLKCHYNGSKVHDRSCYMSDYDFQHQSNPICNNPHHQNSRDIRHYLYGWYNEADMSPYEYRTVFDYYLYKAPYFNDGTYSAIPQSLCDRTYIAQNALTGAYVLVDRHSVQGHIVSNGNGGYRASGQVTAVDCLTGATFNVSTYFDGVKEMLCLWDPVYRPSQDVPLFDTTRTTNKIFHDPEGDVTCWEACNNAARHQANPAVTVDGKTYTKNPNFLNLDREFYLYFPNTGDFYGDGAFGIGSVQKPEGKGYVNNMDTTTWVQNKYCTFDFDVIYDIDGNPDTTNDCICYKAGEKVILGTFKPETKANGTKTGRFIDDGASTGYKYMFYVPLENHEMSNAQIHCYAVGLNAGTDTWAENFGTHNYERSDAFYAYHDGKKDTTLDLVGQIGGLTLMDTGDFRFSETFKQPLNEWLIKNLVHKVDYRKQNFVVADSIDVRGNDYRSLPTTALNTYGTQTYKEKQDKILKFPLTPALNVNPALWNQPLRPGYATYLSLETIGDYYGEEVNNDTSRKVQIRPLYYKMDLATGKFTQLDVYMLDNGLYKCINKFDSNEPTTEHEWPYYFNWEGEKDRRMVTPEEENNTKLVENALTFVRSSDYNAETGYSTPTTVKATIPKGDHYKFGNAQMLHLRARNRTFVGTDYTNKVWHNGRVGSQDVQDPNVRLKVKDHPELQDPSRPVIFDKVSYHARGQRWHFSLGLPSSTVFVEKGKEPVQEEIEKISGKSNVIVVALEIRAKGDVWTLEYGGVPREGQKIQVLPPSPDNPSQPPRIYDYSPDPNGPGDKPIVEIYTSQFSSKDDLSVEGTH